MARSTLQLVVKVTKYCNLRCRYCYEYAELGQKQRMALSDIAGMFRNLVPYARNHGFQHLHFTWHGGEPFLIPLSYYRDIAALQEQEFAGTGLEIWNTAQTNLTVLTPDHLAFLQSRELFDGIGVSYDVVGMDRVDSAGAVKNDLVARNLSTIDDCGIAFGGIAVLSRSTVAHVEAIYDFYDARRIPFRFLPFYLSADDAQSSRHSLTFNELVDALRRAFLRWAASENATSVDPIDDCLEYVTAYFSGNRTRRYDKRDDEFVLIVNRDGNVWGMAETYDDMFRYGNLFQEEVGAILGSSGRNAAIDRANERLRTHCTTCPYFGACPGHFVGEATAIQERMLRESGCAIRALLDFMVPFFEETGLAAMIAERSCRTKDVRDALRSHGLAQSAV